MANHLLVLFCCFLTLGHSSDAALLLDVRPATISPDLNNSLNINCTFLYDSLSNVSIIMSLVLSKNLLQATDNSRFQDLVSLNVFNPDQVNYLSKVEASASGEIRTRGDSYLNLLWNSPTQNEFGVYKCELHGMDKSGRCVTLSQTAHEFSIIPGLDELTKMVVKLQTDFHDETKCSSLLLLELERVEKNCNKTIASVQKDIAELQRQRVAAEAYQTQTHEESKILKGTGPLIDVHPSEIDLGLTDALEVNCSFTNNDSSNMAAPISLILSRANASGEAFVELAGITTFSPHTVNQVTADGFTSSGAFDQAGESYLHLKWERPSEHQSGSYQCAVHGVDLLGHNIVMEDTAKVTVDEPNLGDVMGVISEMRQQIDEIVTYTKSLEQQVENLKDKVEHMDNYTRYLEADVALLKFEKEFYYALTYKNHTYFISKNGYVDSNNSIAVCKQYGADLVEIDDIDEYHAIQKFLSSSSGINVVLISGTDQAREGQWVLQSSGKPMPFIDWFSGQPVTSTTYNCINLWKSPGWRMGDDQCHWSSLNPSYRFICELPLSV